MPKSKEVLIKGKTYPSVSRAAIELGVAKSALVKIIKSEVDIDRNVDVALRRKRGAWRKRVSVNGVQYSSITEAARVVGLSEPTLRRRMMEQGSNVVVEIMERPRFELGSIEHLKELALNAGFSDINCWYGVNRGETLPQSFAHWVKRKWDNDLLGVLERIYPETYIAFWKFSRVPVGAWSQKHRRDSYLKWLERKLGYQNPSDWYAVTAADFKNNHGGTLLAYTESIFEIVSDLYPNENWVPWRFAVAPNGTWVNTDNHRVFLKNLAVAEGFTEPEHWYGCTRELIVKHGGARMVSQYASVYDLISRTFPELNLKFWNFPKSRGNWEILENQREFLRHVENVLGYTKPEDWYGVSEADFLRLKGVTLLSYYGDSIGKCVTEVFPEYDLKLEEFRQSSKMERRLYELVKQHYGEDRVKFRFKHNELRFPSGRKMELDIFVPHLMLAIEYQGKQHYQAVESWGGEEALNHVRIRDEQKRRGCAALGINLIEIKYDEWDGSIEPIMRILDNSGSI